MQRNGFPVRPATVLVLAAMVVGWVTGAQAGARPAPQEHVLYTFTGGTDGGAPAAGLVFDGVGNLYGTTLTGGATCKGGKLCGTVFQLTPQAGGGWAETVLYNFKGGNDGGGPAAGLVFDPTGNLYGTTESGGANAYGTVLQLTPQAGGTWSQTVLYSFNLDGKDGYQPGTSLAIDSAGNLYGTTPFGGAAGYGTVFELSPGTQGKWTETILYSFTGGSDGANPAAALALDSAGKLYGAAGGGGISNYGTVFQLTPQGNGTWNESVLYSFGGKGKLGAAPNAVTLDPAGNLFLSTAYGGAHNPHGGYGAFVQLTQKSGAWSESVLHSFDVKGGKGFRPSGRLILDSAGNLYGTAENGGAYGAGTVFQLSPKKGGGWKATLLYSFTGGVDGSNPAAGLILDSAGNLYGTTQAGGNGFGVVFEITR